MKQALAVTIALCILAFGGGCSKKHPSNEAPTPPTPAPVIPTPSPAQLTIASIEMNPPQPEVTRANNLKVVIANQGGSPSPEYGVAIWYQPTDKPNTFAPVFQDRCGSLQAGATNVMDLRRRLAVNDPGSFTLHVDVTPQGGAVITRAFPFTGVPPGPPRRPPPDGWAMLVVESDPPGAAVEVGLQTVNNITAPGTGRIAGMTPCTIRLQASDVNPLGGVSVFLSRAGYMGMYSGISDGADKLEDHGTYKLSPTPLVLGRLQ